jgi:hypothetical protein
LDRFQGEGELWLGGIASIAVVLVTVMAYAFGVSYLHQYPAETTGPSDFACDTTIRNAKFASSLHASAVPVSDIEQPMFEMLDQQKFILQLDFLNTKMTCEKIVIWELIETSATKLPSKSCTHSDGILSTSAYLTHHDIRIQVVLQDIQPVGGIRLSIFADGEEKLLYSLQPVNFSHSFFNETGGTLAQRASINLAITKVCHSN